MTDKELRSLKRADLIEILYYLRRENDELREENEKLKSRLDTIIDKLVAERGACDPAAADSELPAPDLPDPQ